MYDKYKVQWTMTVTVYHGPSFGHAVELVTETLGRNASTHDSLGTWRGVGVPADSLKQMEAMIQAAFQEHMVTRYGVAESLDWDGGRERDPF